MTIIKVIASSSEEVVLITTNSIGTTTCPKAINSGKLYQKTRIFGEIENMIYECLKCDFIYWNDGFPMMDLAAISIMLNNTAFSISMQKSGSLLKNEPL